MKFRINDKIKHVKTGKTAVITGVFRNDYEIRIFHGPVGTVCVTIPIRNLERNFNTEII